MTDDATLLRRYAEERSEAAFAEFVQRHLPLVHAMAVRRLDGDAHRANDIAQLVFCAAAREARSLSAHAVPAGWLYTATRNAVVDALRAESRRRTREADASALEAVSADATAGLEWSRLGPLLDAAMDELGDDEREAVLLRFFQGRTFGEIGAAVGASEDAARKRVERALDKLRDRLARRGIGSTSAVLATALAAQAAGAAPAGLAASVTSAAVAGGGTALGAGGAAAIWGLTKLQLGLAAAVVAAGAAGLLRQRQVIADLRAELEGREHRIAALTAERAALAATQSATEAEAGRRRAEQSAPSPSPTAATAQTGATSSPAGIVSRGTSGGSAASSVVAPAGPAARSAVQVPPDRLASWHRRYDPFLQERGFTSAQVDRIMQLWFLQEQARLDLQAAVAQQGLRGDAAGIETLRAKLYAPITRELREIMGDAGFAAYNAYEGASYFRSIVTNTVGSRLSGAGFGLSAQQVERLADLVRVHHTSVRVNPTDITTATRIDWRSVADQAAVFLRPEQSAMLREFAATQAAGK